MNPLTERIAQDRLRIPGLERLYSELGARAEFFSWTLSALDFLEPEQTWRAIWLVRRLAKTRELSEAELRDLSERLDAAGHWIARLNVCQLFAVTGVPPSVREEMFPFLREAFADRRVIIRAWAISALVRFGDDARYRSEIRAMLRKARSESGKSMQARLRRLKSFRLK